MIRVIFLCLVFSILSLSAGARAFQNIPSDSTIVSAKARYDSVSGIHRFLFGENFRKEWAAQTRVQVIKISQIKGGLTPIERGGGHQTRSLRLKDKSGNEWVLRSIEKYPDVLLPEDLRETFAKDWLNDNMSAQHPYSALMIPPIAEAVNVLHTNPVIGLVYPDEALGEYKKDFAGTLCLLEEREPAGYSDNTEKMLKNLDRDNDHKVDSAAFLRARILDLFIADWDRHEDQWRWADSKKGDGKIYLPVPRDRDDALFVNEGLLPSLAAKTSYLSFLKGFDGKINDAPEFFYNGRKLDQRFLTQFTHQQWMQITNDFVSKLTDNVIEKSIMALPLSSRSIRHSELFTKLKERRNNLAAAMEKYYFFINRIVDIQTSDKHELIELTDAPNGGLQVSIRKLSKEGEARDFMYSKIFDPEVTKEIRFFIRSGDDSIVVNTKDSDIKLRIVGGSGEKHYRVDRSKNKLKVYENVDNASFSGDVSRLKRHLSADSLNTAYMNTNLYNLVVPLVTVGYNADDGLLLGIGVRAKYEGFRKLPYGSIQKLNLSHALSTGTFSIDYRGEWMQVFRNTDLVINASANVPNNVINFFGRGNETVFNKQGDFKRFYRARFNFYEFDAALRFDVNKHTTASIGPAYQYYDFERSDNTGRFLNSTTNIKSYDSLTLDQNRQHAGLIVKLEHDTRNHEVLPSKGIYFNLLINGYAGLNSFSKSFLQFFPEFSFHTALDRNAAFVISNRTGGGITAGKTTFYQSAFLGGQGNLLGYRKYRFAGEHMFYNNLELRIKLTKVASYVLPGELGLLGVYDIGRVWQKNEDSTQWHQGVGGGLYFAPVRRLVFRGVAVNSKEGWYPYINLGFRF